MRIISFAYTTPALLARRKTRTRRQWQDHYAARFKAGDLVAAYDRSPRFGGKQVGVIRLTHNPVKEPIADMPEEDYDREGFAYLYDDLPHANYTLRAYGVSGLTDFSITAFDRWRHSGGDYWVIDFEVVSINQEESRAD